MEEILKGITIPSPFGENETLGSVLLNFLDKTPNKVAQVCYEDGIEMTCVEMNILSVRIAKNLLKIGIKKGDVAILAVKNTSYLTPLIIASSLVGCTIAPVNIADLENDFKAFPKFFQPKLIFCTSSAVPEINGLLKIHKFTCEIVTLDSGSQIPTEHMNIFDFIKHMEDENNFRFLNLGKSSKLAFGLFFSSGTTNKNKSLISVSHAQILDNFLNIWEINEKDVWFSLAQPQMLAFIFSIVQPIFFSSKKIISFQSHSPQFYTEIIEKYGVTHLFGVTPSISEIFTEYIDKTNCQDKLKSLKCLIVGGTTFISKMHKNIQGVLPFVRILNTYSTIEMGKIISITSESGEIFDTVGKVTPNTQVKIVDKFGNCVYTHDRGEILVRCSNNFLGYVGDEKKTKEALTDDGWFRTGDYGYFDYQERLYVFCRMNDLLNINGIKVSFENVERIINRMKGVTESCVVGIKAPNENDEIPLIFIVKNIHNLSEEVILQCANQFAYKKIQKAYFMDSLPKTMAGEILKRKLREIAATKYNTFQRD